MMRNRELRARENRRIVLFGTAMILISFFILFCVVITVEGKSSPDKKATDRFYAEREAEWKPLVRTCLEEAGLHNAGLMITHREDGEGNREYTIRVHHQRLAGLSEEDRCALEADLEAIAYQDAFCTAAAELTY